LKNSNPLTIAIDASRNISGGAKAHLIGILSECNTAKHGVQAIHVWGFRVLLDQLPDYPWLIKHCPIALEQIIQIPALRLAIAQRAKALSQQYSWKKRCADETWTFVAETYLRNKK
jgi:hypothetical protein